MTALGQTAKNVIYVLVLLFLLIFIFAILGHDLYGDPETGDEKNWGSLPSAFFTLFSLVTVIFNAFLFSVISFIQNVPNKIPDLESEGWICNGEINFKGTFSEYFTEN